MAAITRTLSQYRRGAFVTVTYDDVTGQLSHFTAVNTGTNAALWLRLWWRAGERTLVVRGGQSMRFDFPEVRRWWWGDAEDPIVRDDQITGLEIRWDELGDRIQSTR